MTKICSQYKKSTKERLHTVWINMKKRCEDKNNKLYGGRGITVCDNWSNSFKSFYNWAIKNGYNKDANRGECTLDRIDNNGNYCPENCRWVDMKTQNNNKRNNFLITLNNKTKTLSQWCDFYNIDFDIVWDRIKLGMDIEKALKNPVKEKYKYITYKNETLCINQWAKILDFSRHTLLYRLKSGWSIEDCFEIPYKFDRKIITYKGLTRSIKEHAKKLNMTSLNLYKQLKEEGVLTNESNN